MFLFSHPWQKLGWTVSYKTFHVKNQCWSLTVFHIKQHLWLQFSKRVANHFNVSSVSVLTFNTDFTVPTRRLNTFTIHPVEASIRNIITTIISANLETLLEALPRTDDSLWFVSVLMSHPRSWLSDSFWVVWTEGSNTSTLLTLSPLQSGSWQSDSPWWV